jgi:thiamine biosynthesis lipoprotein
MGTVVNIKILSDKENVSEITERVFGEIEELEKSFSVYSGSGDIARINDNAYPGPVKVSDIVFGLLKEAIRVSEATKGAFDITAGGLSDLWGFGNYGGDKEDFIAPRDDDIKKELFYTGADKIYLDDTKRSVRFENKNIKIDLGGIAKGSIVDETASLLKKLGINNALVDAGGDMHCIGAGPSGRGWEIGILNPSGKSGIMEIMILKDKAVATSGDYQKFFTVNGKRFSHIINPFTGYPIRHGPVSVTVVAEDCKTADAFATAFTVMGGRESSEFCEKRKDLAVFYVEGDADTLKIYKDTQMEEYIK